MSKTYRVNPRAIHAERERNAAKARQEAKELSERIAERRAARTSEAIARLSTWTQRIIQDNEQRGLSVGC